MANINVYLEVFVSNYILIDVLLFLLIVFHSDIVEGSSQRDDQFRNDELLNVVTEDGQVAPKSVMRRMKKLLFKSSDKNYKLGETIEQGRIESHCMCSAPLIYIDNDN